MLFGIYDVTKKCQIHYQTFLNDLYEPLPLFRQQIVEEAFKSLDINGNNSLELAEVKDRYNPAMHPDVLRGVKTVEEARFEFFNLFTTLHSSSNNFSNQARVSFDCFKEWHTIANTAIERD